MIIIISGEQGEGKTTFARENFPTEKALWTSPNCLFSDLKLLEEWHQYIVIDGVKLPLTQKVERLIYKKKIRFQKMFDMHDTTMKMPDIVLITNCYVPTFF